MDGEIDWRTARSPGGGPGSESGGHGAEEHGGVLPAVEGDWLRGPSGAGFGAVDRRSIQTLAPSLYHSLSLPLFCSVCISVSEVKTTQRKGGRIDEKEKDGWKRRKELG